MSQKERVRLVVMERVKRNELSVAQAGEVLGLSYRQTKRVWRRYRLEGAKGLVHGLRGKPGKRAIASVLKQRILARYEERYDDFGPTLAAEYLASFHGFARSVETLRQWMIEDGLWCPKPQRRKRTYQLRERRACVGELVQIDASPHPWLEARGPRCTLVSFIDDATGRLQYARFEPAETSRAYLRAMRAYVSRYGRPVAFYSDRHSIFTKHDPEDPTPTQFETPSRPRMKA